MAARRLPVRRTAAAIWRDTPRLFAAHPLLWAACLALYGAITFLDFRWVGRPSLIGQIGPVWQAFLVDAAMLLLPTLALIPAALATHRTVILGVVESPSTILLDRRRIGRYGALEAAIVAALLMLFVIASVAIRRIDAAEDGDRLPIVLIVLLLLIVLSSFVLILRAAACFPAVAVSEGWVHVIEAWRALRGQTFGLTALSLLSPVGVVSAAWLALLAGSVALREGDEPSWFVTLMDNSSTVLLIVLAYLWVLTMSHIYKAVFDRPPNPVDRP
jgi:hypothetical protein